MQIIESIARLRGAVAGWRRQAQSIALVPTMGNLHAGHMRLIDEARHQAGRVVVSIFVNPSQFGPGEDFSAYPRTLESDAAQVRAAGADLLFLPAVAEMYPLSPERMTHVEVPGLSGDLCGQFRPGHFRGVATIVSKLFNQVQPDVAVFGEKDYQQLTLIRRMAADLDLPVRILGVPTAREPDGLAMSSRNAYLAAEERARAGQLFVNLNIAAEAVRDGRRDFARIEQERAAALAEAGFQVDYFAIRRQSDLGWPDAGDSRLIALVAARLGRTRLIDNLAIDLAGA
jgi:pantoate--beta-alanine ligase